MTTQQVTRFAIQFADGSFAMNGNGRRTHKTEALAQSYITSCLRAGLACPSRESLLKQGYSESSATHRIDQAARIGAIWRSTKVVPVDGRTRA